MSKLTKAIRRFRGDEVRRQVVYANGHASVVSVSTPGPTALERRTATLSALVARYAPPYRLHLACGSVHLPGWINLDLNAEHSVMDAEWDMRDRLPLDDGCVQFIHHEHFLEHLTAPEGIALLRECHRLLAPGGVMHVAMPDMAECVRQYYENDWRQPWMKKYGYEWIATRAEMLNIAFRDWGHQWLYDREELHRRLREAGFETIRDCERLESAESTLRGLETRDESLLVCEAVR
jgi:predicted SAM-dependent methyltransferase